MPGRHDHRIDPELAPFADVLPRDFFADIDAAREVMRSLTAGHEPSELERSLEVEDRILAGDPVVPVRVYRRPGDHVRPGILYLHGGGFCVGDLETEHSLAVALVGQLDIVIVSVDYRLAPEHPYPAGLEDCYRALQWIGERADVDEMRIAVNGTSGGGGLAAALCLLARDRGGPEIAFQCLAVPELDDRLDTPSMRAFDDTPMWSRPNAVESWRYYLAGIDPVPPHAAPARAEDLHDLPPAYIAANELDPLRDEAILYALSLLRDGVSVELHTFPGTFHASNAIPFAAVSRRAVAELTSALASGIGLQVEHLSD
jgi:acetyl esterase